MRGLVVALLFLLAPGAYSFLKMPSKSFFAAQRTGVDRMQPLNTNPRKIDVGEEASTRFGKVCSQKLLCMQIMPGSPKGVYLSLCC